MCACGMHACVCAYICVLRVHACAYLCMIFEHYSGETVEVLLNNMFDADNATDNVILCGISYLLMLVDTKRYSIQCISVQVINYFHLS